MNLQRNAGADPWSNHKLERDETFRLDLGSVMWIHRQHMRAGSCIVNRC
jgi:hypothetical protein